jgi:hypothetical protein
MRNEQLGLTATGISPPRRLRKGSHQDSSKPRTVEERAKDGREESGMREILWSRH